MPENDDSGNGSGATCDGGRSRRADARQQLAIGVALAALVPRAFFGYARSLWLVMNYLVAMAEQRCERERLQP